MVSYPYVPWALLHPHLPFDDDASGPLYHRDRRIFRLLDYRTSPYPFVRVHGHLGHDNPSRLYLSHPDRGHDVYLLDHGLLLGLYPFVGLNISTRTRVRLLLTYLHQAYHLHVMTAQRLEYLII